METFDIIFYRGEGTFSKIIQSVSGSPYSHVALAISDRLVVETNWHYPVSIRINEYTEDMYSLGRVELSREQRDKMYEYISLTLGSRYDIRQAIYHYLNKRFGIPVHNNPKFFTCSEWIDKAFLYAGVDLLPDERSGTVTPADLFSSKFVNVV